MPAVVRPVADPDADQIVAIYAPYVRDSAISFELVPPTVEEMRQRIRTLRATHPWLVCADGPAILGYTYAGRYRERPAYQWSVETTVYVRRDAHRRGIGRALYTALLAIVTAQGFYTAYALITLPGVGSVALHESMGFDPAGVCRGVGYKLGAWRDVGTWELVLRARPASPVAPRAIDDVRASAEWEAAMGAATRMLGG
jgi:phosphinothricin acetyltransferase